MNQINALVKGGLFNAQLANQIFVLCQQLKFSGELLEQSHKSLSYFFDSYSLILKFQTVVFKAYHSLNTNYI